MNATKPLRGLVVAVVAAFTLVAWGGSGGSASAASADGAQNSIGLRLIGDQTQRDDQRGRLYIVESAAPGSSVVRRVEVTNTTTSALQVELYGAGAAISDGSFVGAEGRAQNELSSWTSLTPSSLIVESGGASQATVRIDVPADAAPGEQYGAVWAQVSAPPAGGVGVTQVSRVGVRMYVLVGPGGAPPGDFAIESMSATRTPDGLPAVIASVRNTGGRALDISGSLDLADGPSGLRAGPFPAELGLTLAIGAVGTVQVVLDGSVPAGPWGARLVLRSGFVERSIDGVMTFPAGGPSEESRPWIWVVVASLLALVAAGVTAALVRRRMRIASP